jgi:hypothetical protein
MWGANEPQAQLASNNNANSLLMIRTISQMIIQLEVHIAEIICRRLRKKVFGASMDQRIMMTFKVMMTKTTAMCAMEMMTRL